MYRTLAVRLVLAAVALSATVSCGRDPDVVKREHFERANAFSAQAKYREAIVEYLNALKQDEKFGEARYRLAEAYAASDDPKRAYREYVRAADLLPAHADAQLKAASYHLIAGQFQDAESRVKRVLERDPSNVQAQILRGTALAGLRDFDGAVKQVEEAIQLQPGRGITYVNLATLRLAQGKSEEARAAFEKAVELAPDSLPALLSLANFQWVSGELQAVEKTLRRALAINPKHTVANHALATLLIATGRPAEAEAPLKTMAEGSGSLEARFALANYYARVGRRDEAREILQRLIEDKRSASSATLRLANLEYASGETKRAYAMIDALIASQPNNPSAMTAKGEWLFREGKHAEALSQATAAVRADPNFVPGHYLMGMLHASQRNPEAAAESFREVLRLNPTIGAAQLHLSRLELARGNADAAVELADAALKNAPQSPVAQLAVARGSIARRDFARAEAVVSSLVAKYPSLPVVHALNGSLRSAMDDLAAARTSYEHALKLDPKSVEAVTGLTVIDVREKKADAARARVDAALAQTPDSSSLLILAARVYAVQGDLAGAERVLRKAIQVAPSDMLAYSLLAASYLSQRKLDQARAEFEGIARRDAKDVPSRTMVGMIAESQKNLADAKTWYQHALDVDPRAAVAANNLAMLYADAGQNLDQALQLAQTAAQELAGHPDVLDTVGWVYYQKELPTLAIPQFEASIAKSPTNPLYHYHLGLAHLKAGNPSRARASLERALQLRPDFPFAPQARKALDSIQG